MGEKENQFQQELTRLQELVNASLEKYSVFSDVPEKKLEEAMCYSLLAGGKRLRPILLLATYFLFKSDYHECIPYFVGMEMVHNFSLIHDDMPCIDNDDLRHGKPSNHKVFGEATALLAGDTLLNRAYVVMTRDIVNEKDPQKLVLKQKVLHEFSMAVERMIIGEFVDVETENQVIDIDLLAYMHKNKTGALIKESIKMGALLGGADQEQMEALMHYADNIGLAFQVKDDILSEIGNVEKMGKPVGNDRNKNKNTYISKYGLEKSKQILEELVKEAVLKISIFGEKSTFLKELAYYIEEREK